MKRIQGRYRFYNLPQELSLSDYKKVKEKVLKQLYEAPDIKSVYSFGQVNHPGISDLDIVFVTKTEKLNHSKAEDYVNLHDRDQVNNFILTHHLGYPVNEFCLYNSKLCHYVPDLHCEIGEKINIRDMSDSEQVLANFTSIIGIIPVRMFQSYSYLTGQYVNARHALLALYSIRKSIAITKTLSGQRNKNWGDFETNICRLRTNWFSTNPKDRDKLLISLLDRSLPICRDIIDKLAKRMIKEDFDKLLFKNTSGYILELKGNRLILFSDKLWRKMNPPFLNINNFSLPNIFPIKVKEVIKQTHWQALVLPRVLSSYFYIHSEFEGEFSQLLKAKLLLALGNKFDQSEIPYLNAFKKQAQIYNRYLKFLFDNNFRYSWFPIIDLFFQNNRIPCSPVRLIKNAIIGILSKINRQKVRSQIKL